MRTEYRLWHWPVGVSCGVMKDLYPTTEAAMHAVGEWSAQFWRRSPAGGWYMPEDFNSTAQQRWSVSAEQVPESLEDRAILAIRMLLEYGQEDGDHRKSWVIDQALRILAGDDYEQVIIDYCDGEDGPETYSWDVGIAP